MRIAVVTEIHGNLTAFDCRARRSSPDFSGLGLSRRQPRRLRFKPGGVVDRIRALGWAGVLRNTDEALAVPDSLTSFAKESPHLEHLFRMIE